VFTARYGLSLYNQLNLGLFAYIVVCTEVSNTGHWCQCDLAKSAVAVVVLRLELLWVWMAVQTFGGNEDWNSSDVLGFSSCLTIYTVSIRCNSQRVRGVYCRNSTELVNTPYVWQCYRWCYLHLPLPVIMSGLYFPAICQQACII
jgi:hypothetical protein